jgi:hypothetical protein
MLIGRFAVQKSKLSTARVAMWKELCNPCVYTLEASFLGPSIAVPIYLCYTQGNVRDGHFSVDNLMEIGKHICQAISVFGSMKRQLASAGIFIDPTVDSIVEVLG